MKSLSDFTGEEAIELWADLYDQFAEILTDKEVIEFTRGEKLNLQKAAQIVIKNHRSALLDIFARIGNDIDGANIFPAVIMLLTEMVFGGKASTFFGRSAQKNSEEESSGNVTENTRDAEK